MDYSQTLLLDPVGRRRQRHPDAGLHRRHAIRHSSPQRLYLPPSAVTASNAVTGTVTLRKSAEGADEEISSPTGDSTSAPSSDHVCAGIEIGITDAVTRASPWLVEVRANEMLLGLT
jgi:hypothetical protein